MIKSKTYNGQAGLNYIQSSELAFATVYAVKREGTQYDKYVTGSTNRTHIHEGSTGKIFFVNAFAPGGERVFVIYKQNGPEPPPVCTLVSYSGVLPPGNVGIPYSQSISLTGTAPYVLTPTSVPAWAVMTLGTSAVNITGTPDAVTTETFGFDIMNCGGTVSFSQEVDFFPSLTTTYVTNYVAGAVINSMIGLSYTLVSGSFPINYLEGISATHPHFTGVIKLNISGIVFPSTLKLFINTVEIEAVPVNSDGLHEFTPQIILSTDLVQIVLIP